jgi:activator of HSP90 ATPase
MKTIIQKVKFKTSPEALFNILMDSKKHSAATGGKALIRRKVGGAYSAWAGYIRGKTLYLAPGKTIVQSWRTTGFKKTDPDSIIVFTFEKVRGGCLMTMTQTGVPDKEAGHYQTGWYEHYWNPIQKYLKGL